MAGASRPPGGAGRPAAMVALLLVVTSWAPSTRLAIGFTGRGGGRGSEEAAQEAVGDSFGIARRLQSGSASIAASACSTSQTKYGNGGTKVGGATTATLNIARATTPTIEVELDKHLHSSWMLNSYYIVFAPPATVPPFPVLACDTKSAQAGADAHP